MADRSTRHVLPAVAVALCLALSGAGMAAGAGRGQSAAASRPYTIQLIGPRGDAQIAALADDGRVDGTIVTQRSSLGFVARGRRVRLLRPPKPFTSSSVVAGNRRGGLAVEAWRRGGAITPFAVIASARRFRWLRLPEPHGYAGVSLAGVAANGDVTGTALSRPVAEGSTSRAVLWRPLTRRYSRPSLLSLHPGCRSATATGIWSGGRRVLVAGVESCGRGRYPAPATLWNLKPRFAPGPNIVAMGGTARALYVAGVIRGIDTASSWYGRVSFKSHGRLGISYHRLRPYRPAVEQFTSVSAIGADARGRMIAVGTSTAIQHGVPGGAIVWRSGQPRRLQNLIPKRSRWTLLSATALNRRGQIAGAGRFHGAPRLYLLTPRA